MRRAGDVRSLTGPGSVWATPNPTFAESSATAMGVEARTEVMSCLQHALGLHTGPGKNKTKVTPGEDTPLQQTNKLVSLHEREGEETWLRGKGVDGGEGRLAAGFILLRTMAPWLLGEEMVEPHHIVQEELNHSIHVPCYYKQINTN